MCSGYFTIFRGKYMKNENIDRSRVINPKKNCSLVSFQSLKYDRAKSFTKLVQVEFISR